jgi:hypothetical protein
VLGGIALTAFLIVAPLQVQLAAGDCCSIWEGGPRGCPVGTTCGPDCLADDECHPCEAKKCSQEGNNCNWVPDPGCAV